MQADRSALGLATRPAEPRVGRERCRALGTLRGDHAGSTLLAELCSWLVRAATTPACDEVRWSRRVVAIVVAAIVVAVPVVSAVVAPATAMVSAEKLVEETHHILLCMS